MQNRSLSLAAALLLLGGLALDGAAAQRTFVASFGDGANPCAIASPCRTFTRAMAARDATTAIPIVTVLVSDPVGAGLVASLARPGGNVTGMSSAARDNAGKGLELLKEVAPGLSRVAVLWSPTTTVQARVLKEIEAAARTLRLQVRAFEVQTPEDLERAFGVIRGTRAEALIPLDGPFMWLQRARIVFTAARSISGVSCRKSVSR